MDLYASRLAPEGDRPALGVAHDGLDAADLGFRARAWPISSSGFNIEPAITAANFIGQATIPTILFVLGMTIPWRTLTPRREILAVSAVKLLVAPLLTWALAQALFAPLDEAQYAAVIEASTPAFVTLLVLASRFRLDSASAALLIGWSTILFWITLPLLMAAGLVR